MTDPAVGAADGTDPSSEDQLELRKLQFDYAWKWFAFHAEQRTKMFNFMLVATGIFATAVATAYVKSSSRLAFWLCIAGALVAAIFSLLDRRNRDLIWRGEEVLIELEKK
ncbi:MAG: hypothetical protein WCF20_14015 [Methylovirgula sp.]